MEIKGSEKPIYSIEVTKATRHDSPMLIPLLKRITGDIGDKVKLEVEDFHFADPTKDYKAIVVSKA